MDPEVPVAYVMVLVLLVVSHEGPAAMVAADGPPDGCRGVGAPRWAG